MHRVRQALIKERTAKANQIRAFMYERGIVAPQELSALRRALPEWLEDAENALTSRFRPLLAGLYDDLRRLDERVRDLVQELIAIAHDHEPVSRLEQLRGVGPVTASALYALVGDARQYRNGRELAVALGLTPRQHSSGGREKLLGISKRGDKYVRTLLIHGARSALRTAPGKEDRVSKWAVSLAQRSHPNKAATALANKMARVAWAMLRHGTSYEPDRAAA